MQDYAAARIRVNKLMRQAKDYPVERLEKREPSLLKNYADYTARGRFRGALSFVKSFGLSVPNNLGKYHVLNGEHALGWQELERSWFLRAFPQTLLGADTANDAPCLLAHAIVLNDSEMAERLAELVRHRLLQPPADWQGLHLPAFMLGLHARWIGKGDFAGVQGAFLDVVNSWTGPGLTDALDAICDHHLDAAIDEESITNEYLGYASIPIELVAIRIVREREGLATPQVTHPFANTLLAEMPLGGCGYDRTSDPWITRAVATAKAGGLLPNEWLPNWPR